MILFAPSFIRVSNHHRVYLLLMIVFYQCLSIWVLHIIVYITTCLTSYAMYNELVLWYVGAIHYDLSTMGCMVPYMFILQFSIQERMILWSLRRVVHWGITISSRRHHCGMQSCPLILVLENWRYVAFYTERIRANQHCLWLHQDYRPFVPGLSSLYYIFICCPNNFMAYPLKITSNNTVM